MVHFFDVDVAKEYGIECAVIFQNIGFWVQHNRENGLNDYDGSFWTYNSAKAFEHSFPYMSYQKIGRALTKLEEVGLIKSGNYNKSKFDRTKWYTLTEDGYRVFRNENSHLSNLINGDITGDKPIPDINTDSKPNINNNNVLSDSLEEFFNRVWMFYPVKKGKGAVSRTAKQKLMKVGEDQLKRCVERYLTERDELKASGRFCPELMNGSTFFNSRYIDYLDENYIQKEAPKELPEEEPVMDLWVGD